MPAIVFYTTPGCRLCDQARDIVVRYEAYAPVAIRERDVLEIVDAEPTLAERIPVLETEAGERLYWPFDGAVLHRWIQERTP